MPLAWVGAATYYRTKGLQAHEAQVLASGSIGMSDTTRPPALRQARGPGLLPVVGGAPPSLGLDSCLEDLSAWKPFTLEDGGARPHLPGNAPGLAGVVQTAGSSALDREALGRLRPPDDAIQNDMRACEDPQRGLLRQACEASQRILFQEDFGGLALGACSLSPSGPRRAGNPNDSSHRGVPSSLQLHAQSRPRSGSPAGEQEDVLLRRKQASDAVPSGQSVPTPLPPSSPRPLHQPHHRVGRTSAVPRFLSQRGLKSHPGQREPDKGSHGESSQGRASSIMRPWADMLGDSSRKSSEGHSRGDELVTSLSCEPKHSPRLCRIHLPGERRLQGSKNAGTGLQMGDTGQTHSTQVMFGAIEPLRSALSSGDEAAHAASTNPSLRLRSEEAGPASPADVVPATSMEGTAGGLILGENDTVLDGMDASQAQESQLGGSGLLGTAEQAHEMRQEGEPTRAANEPPHNLMDVYIEGSSREGQAGPGPSSQGVQELGAETASPALARFKQLSGASSEAAACAQQEERSFRFRQPASAVLNWRFFISDPSAEAGKADGSRALLPSWPIPSQPRAPANPNALRSPRRAGAGHARPSPAPAAHCQGLAFGTQAQGAPAEGPSPSQRYVPTGSKRANTELAEDMSPGSSYEAEVSDYSEEERAERQRAAGRDAGLASAGPGLGVRYSEGVLGATPGTSTDGMGGAERGGDLPAAGPPRGAPGDLPLSQPGALEEGLWQGMSFSQGASRRPGPRGHQPRKRRRRYTGGYTSSEGLSVQGSERLGMAYASDPATDHASHGREARALRRGLPHAPGSSSGGADQAYYYTRSRSGRAREAARRRGGGAGSRGSIRGSGGDISSSSTGLDLPHSRHRLRSEQWYAMHWQSGAESEYGSDVGYGGDGELGEGCEEDPIQEGDEGAGEAARPAHAPGSQHKSPPKASVAAQAPGAGATGPGLVKKLRWPRAGEKEKERERERAPEGPAPSAPHVRRRMHLLDQVREGHSGPEVTPAAAAAAAAAADRRASEVREDDAQRRWRLPSRILPGEGPAAAAPPAVPPRQEPLSRGPATFEAVAEALRPATFRSNSATGASERESSGPSFTVRGGRGIRRACRPTRMRRKRRSSRNFGPQPTDGAAGPFPGFDPWQRGAESAAPGSGPFSLSPWASFDGRRPFKAFGWGGGSGYEQEEDGEGESGRESILGQGGSELRGAPTS